MKECILPIEKAVNGTNVLIKLCLLVDRGDRPLPQLTSKVLLGGCEVSSPREASDFMYLEGCDYSTLLPKAEAVPEMWLEGTTWCIAIPTVH